MNETWYDVVEPNAPLTQGDIIFHCPLVTWSPASVLAADANFSTTGLQELVTAYLDDVVALTQACDLEHNKVPNVVLCPHVPLSRFRRAWEETITGMGQTPTEKAWRRTCRDIAGGHVWNQAFLNQCDHAEISTEVRVVDFRDLYTIPRSFLEAMLQSRGERRLRLLPPYREHLSQSFARFFMRVGLPQPIELPL